MRGHQNGSAGESHTHTHTQHACKEDTGGYAQTHQCPIMSTAGDVEAGLAGMKLNGSGAKDGSETLQKAKQGFGKLMGGFNKWAENTVRCPCLRSCTAHTDAMKTARGLPVVVEHCGERHGVPEGKTHNLCVWDRAGGQDGQGRREDGFGGQATQLMTWHHGLAVDRRPTIHS